MTDDTKSTRHMVYISFHKGDATIRYSFVSHLSASLRRKGLISSASSCVDNSFKETKTEKNNLEAFVVVISEKYVLSAECLDELAEIVDHQRNKQNVVVLPVFHCITQSEVVHKSRLDILRDTFPQENYSAERVARWIGALKKTTDSYKPRMDCGDFELVEEIAIDVYEKMFPTKRIGIYSRLLELENFLRKQPWGVRSIGIWGMPGIGKTTLAKAAFDQFSGDYEASCFIKDFGKEFDVKGLYRLLKEYLGETLKKEFNINNSVTKQGPKRVLIILDNVYKPLDADAFLNGLDCFDPGSLIIITSTDRQVLVQCGVNQIYEVQGLNEDEAKQLFFSCVFGIEWRKKSGLQILAPYLMSVIQYSSGNPLALNFYGKMVAHKKPTEMETELFRLEKQVPPSLIMEAFRSSYNTLNENEKTMFLDIACFFMGENVDYVMQLFEGCGLFPHVGIYVLVEKCLVTIVERKLQMPNLIHVVGKEISNEETIQHERHLRLWDASIIKPLLGDEETKLIGESKAVEDIEALFLDISNLDFFVKPNAFKSMHNLRLLKIYSSNPGKNQGLRIRNLESLPNKLRLLHWEDYPLQSLPMDFDPRHLVELNMPYSKLQTLWEGTKNLKMMKTMRLCHSQELVEINDFRNAENIEVIDLQGCTRFQSFPATDHLQRLRVINLSGCIHIKSFPEVPPNIEALYLSGTGIREILTSSAKLFPQYFGNCRELVKVRSTNQDLHKLACSNLEDCLHVQNLDFLRVLDLSGCSELEEIQCFPRNLKKLDLSETAIREILSSISHLTALEILDLTKCKRLQHLPMGISNLTSLVKLMLSGCSELEEIPDLPRSLKFLNLAKTPIRKLPTSFEDLTELISLDLKHCKRLQRLKIGFFKSIVRVELSGCSELEYIKGYSLQDMGQLHIDGTDKVMLCGLPPCNVILIWENWRTFHVMPREKKGSKCSLALTPFLATPYQSKLPSSLFSCMYAMVSLFLNNACLLDIHIPQEISHFPSLKALDLGGNGFSNLPESIKQLCNLERLILCHCENLKSLPELPQSLEILNAHGCVSLKYIHRRQFPRHCTFSNCFNLSPDSVEEILDAIVAHVGREHAQLKQKLIKAPVSSFSVPAFGGLKSIFHMQRSSSVKIQFTPHTKPLLGFRISVVVAFWDDSYSAAGFGIRYVCRWENKKGLSRQLERIFYCWTPEEVAQKVQKNHMFVFCDVSMHPGASDGNDLDILDDLVVFEFVPVNLQNRLLDDCCTVTECRVDVITAGTDKTSLNSRRPASVLDSAEVSAYVLPPYKKRKRCFSGSEDIEMEHQRLILSETKQEVAAHKASFSSSSLFHRQRYHVFLSFCEDVRRTFVSYLIKEFKWIGITAICSGFMGGQSMSRPEVTQAIKESRISIVILSKNYVSSSKCLNELVEILTWREETWGHRVIPIYYEVDASDVRKQTKTIGKGLVGTSLVGTSLGYVEKLELRWIKALTYIVDINGVSSQDWDDEGKMIEKIAFDVSNQVNVMESNAFSALLTLEKDEKDIEIFNKSIWDELNGVRSFHSWYMCAFSLIYLFLLTSKSRILL